MNDWREVGWKKTENEGKEHGAKMKYVEWEEGEAMWVVFQVEIISASCSINSLLSRERFLNPLTEQKIFGNSIRVLLHGGEYGIEFRYSVSMSLELVRDLRKSLLHSTVTSSHAFGHSISMKAPM